MISHIYTLDINSVNNMITEMNSELGKTMGGYQSTSFVPSGKLIYDKMLDQPDTQHTILDLDGNKHGGYVLQFIINNTSASASVPRLYYNKDLTNANYEWATWSAAWANDAIIGTPSIVTGTEITYNGFINITPSGYISTHIFGTGSKTLQVGSDYSHHYKNKVDNITQIDLVMSVTASLGEKSRFRLWGMM